jgi:hypothetical protein
LTAVSIPCRFTSAPTKYCHVAVKRLFRYFRRTVYLPLEYCTGDIMMNVFVDSHCACDTNSRISTSGMALSLGSSLIQWHSKKHSTVSPSTCEAVYRHDRGSKGPDLINEFWRSLISTQTGLSLCILTSRQLDGQLGTSHLETGQMLMYLCTIFMTWLKHMDFCSIRYHR